MRPVRTLGLLALGAGAAAGAVRSRRQWSSAIDPCNGTALSPILGVEEEVLRPDGTVISTVDAGNPHGPPAVLVHGWMEDRRVWGPVARRLSASGMRVVAYDQRGHGRSTAGGDGYTIEALGSDLAAVLEALDLRQAIVAGHSMGGMAAQALCIDHPDVAAARVRGLVLVATTSGPLRALRRAGSVLASPLLDRAMKDPRLGPFLVRSDAGRHPVLAHLDAAVQMLVGTPGPTRTGFAQAMGAMDLAEGIAKLDLPVTVVAGERDRLLPLAHSRRMAERIPNARLEIVPDAGHLVPYEAPDVVTRAIRETAAAG